MRFIFFILSLLFLLIVLLLLIAPIYQQRNVKTQVVASYDTINLLVPVREVRAGEKLTKSILAHQQYPAHLITGQVLRNYEEEDLFALYNLPADLPISLKNLTQDFNATLNPVLAKIPNGMRAMSVRVDVTSSVEGWAGSGSIVDVLLVEKEQTLVVAEGVRILSSERSTTPVDSTSQPVVPNTVTILVTQEQCLAINTAIPRGRIALVLRSSADDNSWKNKQMLASQLQPTKSLKSKNVTGAISTADKKYILVEGRWIQSLQVPEGFFIK